MDLHTISQSLTYTLEFIWTVLVLSAAYVIFEQENDDDDDQDGGILQPVYVNRR